MLFNLMIEESDLSCPKITSKKIFVSSKDLILHRYSILRFYAEVLQSRNVRSDL